MKKLRIIVFALIALAFVIAFAVDAERVRCPDMSVTVQQGDSAWLIAETHCEGNIQNATDKIVDEYGITLRVGQVIVLP